MADPIHAFEADGTPSAGAAIALSGKANTAHTHSWASVTGKPTTFAPAAHTHPQSAVTGLETRLGTIETKVDSPTAAWLAMPTIDPDMKPAGHGAPPQILRQGTWRYLRGRYARIDDTAFGAGIAYEIIPLEPGDVPGYTQGGMGQITGSGYCRIEVSKAGVITVTPSASTTWVGIDGLYWTTN